MILLYEDTETPYNGRVGGSIFTSRGRRGVGRIRNRPANGRQRERWRPPWTLAPGVAAFKALSSADQEDWNSWAEENFCWPIQGSPRFLTGELYFANAYTVLEIFSGGTPAPTVPIELPSWQEKPKFFEFADWIFDTYTLTAETDFTEETELIFSGLPPAKTVWNGNWFGEEMIGADTLYTGLMINDEYTQLHTMFENAFGTIDPTQKIWGRVWEKYPNTGFIRLLKDPCTPDPTEAAAAVTLNVDVENGYNSQVENSYIDLYAADFEVIGESNILYIDYGYTLSYGIDLTEGHTLDDIEWVAVQIYWADGSSWIENLDYYGEQPWQRVLYPD